MKAKRPTLPVLHVTEEQARNLGPFLVARLKRGEEVSCGGRRYRLRTTQVEQPELAMTATPGA